MRDTYYTRWFDDGSAVLTNTQLGFQWGAAVVERVFDDPKGGTVISIRGHDRKGAVNVRVSPHGRVVEIVP